MWPVAAIGSSQTENSGRTLQILKRRFDSDVWEIGLLLLCERGKLAMRLMGDRSLGDTRSNQGN
jgi:hypothetical protein